MELKMNLPQHCTQIDEEEMLYIDGGDATNFAKNIYGIVTNSAIKAVLGLPSFAAIAKMSYWAAVTTFPALAGKIAALTGNPVIIGIAALGGVAAVTYLWNVRVFY